MCTKNLNDMIYSSWDIEHDILKLVILGHFLLFYQKRTQKTKFWNNKKNCWRYHHYSCEPKITNILFTVPRYRMRQTELFVTFCYFLLLLPLHTCVSYIKIIWCMVPEIWSVTDRIFLSFWIIFALLPL